VPSVGNPGDKFPRTQDICTMVPNLFEMSAVCTAVGETETVHRIIALLLVCEDFDP
jgi:hypothetical protein